MIGPLARMLAFQRWKGGPVFGNASKNSPHIGDWMLTATLLQLR